MLLPTLRNVAAIIITTLLLAASTFAQQNTREVFERARMLDESNQNLSEAIKLYSQVVSQSNEQRALAARAQYRIGVLYERLGRKAEAQRAFQAVVRQYADQPEASRARAKLPASAKVNVAAKNRAATSESSAPTVRQLWAGSDVDTEGAPSPDGRYLSFADEDRTNNLAIRELINGQVRMLTNDGKPNWDDGCYESIWSPDGKQIVYGWLTKDNEEKYHAEAIELRIINTDGSGKRILYPVNGPIYTWPFDWSPDGKYILAGLQTDNHAEWPDALTKKKLELILISVADGAVKPLKTLDNWDWRLSKRIFFSPDGNHIVYSVAAKDGLPARDIFLFSNNGKNDVPLIQSAADDYALGWAPGTNKVLFASDRTGTTDIWSISVADGRPQGSPELVKRDVGSIQPLGIAANGSLYYSATAGIREIYSAKLDPQTGKLIAGPTPLYPRRTGSNVEASWSPDGREIAYRTTVWQGSAFAYGSKLVSAAIVIRNVETGAEREIVPQLSEYFGGAVWSPDGRAFAVYGKSKDGQQGFFRVDAQTSETTPLLLSGPGEINGAIEWSRDGKAIFFSSFASGRYSIVVRNVESGEKKTLFQANQVVTSLRLSPNGQHLAFRLQSKGYGINWAAVMTMPSAGGETRELFRVKDENLLGGRSETGGAVAWTSDGRYILFTMRSDKNTDSYDLWRVPAEGGPLEKLGLKMDLPAQLRTHPDGQQIMFTAGSRKPEVWVMENFLPARGKEQPRSVANGKR